MHDCQKFCEDLADRNLSANSPVDDQDIAAELISCESCLSFYRDTKAILKVVDSAATRPPELPDAYWQEFSNQLQSNLQEQPRRFFNPNRAWPLLAFAASLLVVLALAGYHALTPQEDAAVQNPRETVVQATVDVMSDLDPVTVDYLGQSELFLRTFVKLRATDTEDLADARSRARRQLVELRQRKEAAAEIPPVRGVLEDYETVLRDINNMRRPSTADIADIQYRIERNGLIATMKAYQPRLDATAEPWR
jgi:hypothetical protein